MASAKGSVTLLLVSSGLFLLLSGTVGESNFGPGRNNNGGLRDGAANVPRDHAETPTTGYACEGSQLNIRCGAGRKIRILRANYGRFKISICNDRDVTEGWNLQCMSTRSLNIVNEMCVGRPQCLIQASNRLFGDPCNYTPKYLEVQYSCMRAYVDPITPTPEVIRVPSTEESVLDVTTKLFSTSRERLTPKPPVYEERYCEARVARNISWPRTIAGQEVRKECPNNLKVRAAIWRCGSFPIHWVGQPDLSGCRSQETNILVEKVARAKEQVSSEIVEEVAVDLLRLTENRNQYGGDLAGMAEVMEELVNQVDVQVARNMSTTPHLVNKVQGAVLNASSNMFDAGVSETWKDLPQSDQTKTATRVLSAVENSAFQRAKLHSAPTAFIDITVNIVLEVNVIETDDDVKDVVFPKKTDLEKNKHWKDQTPGEIRLSGAAIKELGVDGLARVIFLTYNNLEELLRPQGDRPDSRRSGMIETEVHSVQPLDPLKGMYEEARGREESEVYPDGYHETSDNGNDIGETSQKPVSNGEEESETKTVVNSKVISASVNERKDGSTQKLSEPIYYTLEHQTTENVFNPTCSFWEYSERTMNGKWSQFGCEKVDTNLTHTTCRCNHLTNFAVLMDVQGTVLPSHHQFALALITYLGCIISIVCLFLAFCTFQFFKNLQCDRNTIHKNLCLSLFIAEVIFLAGIAQYDKKILCSVVAGLLHYFFLVSFAWMCMEGIQLYVMLIEVFEAEKSRVKYYYITAYGVPAIVVGVAAAVDHSGYGTETHCWLRIDTGFIWAFVGPVIAVITINIVMLSIAIYMMCKHAATAAAWKMKQKSKMDNIKSWLKGATVLVVLLGLTWSFGLLYINEQSLTMAYIFTILNSLQGLFIYIFHCTMNEKVQKEYKRACRRARWLPEAIRVRYGGAKPYVSTTPNQSSTSGGNYFTRLLSGRRRKRSSTTSLPKSSSSGTKWFVLHKNRQSLSNGGCRESQLTNPSSPHDSAIYSEPTEDPGGYLEPVSLRIDDSMFEGANCDLSAIEGSIVDSDFLSEYCKNGLPINVEKYKIQKTPPTYHDGKTERPESLYDSDPDMMKLREKERLLSEYDNSSRGKLDVESDDDGFDSLPKKGLSDSVQRRLNNLNDLNRDASSNEDNREECIYAEIDKPNWEPGNGNITPAQGTLKKDNVTQCSLPQLGPVLQGPPPTPPEDVAIDKVKKALSASHDGQILLIHGKPIENRLSAGTQAAMDAHRYRLHSSDC